MTSVDTCQSHHRRGAALQPVCLDLEMAVCLENGAWIVEAQGFFMRHQFGLRHELMTRVNAFDLLLVMELSGGYDQPYDAAKPSRKLRRHDFFPSRRFSASVTQAAAGERPKPFGRTLRGPALPRRLCLRRYHRRRRREGWRIGLQLKGYEQKLRIKVTEPFPVGS